MSNFNFFPDMPDSWTIVNTHHPESKSKTEKISKIFEPLKFKFETNDRKHDKEHDFSMHTIGGGQIYESVM